jgi:tripartite-type tricarboxylate transporter receptor subunit TctC
MRLGYTLLLANLANAINATLYDRLKFNFIHDIAPVAGIMRVPHVMVVNPTVPAKTIPEFIAMPRPIRARSIWRQAASEARPMCRASCST